MDSRRDWGHARDYVEMQWRMLQQSVPEDFVIATGVQYSVREFIEASARELGMQLAWDGDGVAEVGRVTRVEAADCAVKPGQVIVRVDPRYFRPTEVETLLGDPSKAREKLGWVPTTSFEDLVREMTQADFKSAQRDALVRSHGYSSFTYAE